MSILWSKNELTFDHLLQDQKVVRLMGKCSNACSNCNVQKGGRLLETSRNSLFFIAPTTEDLHKNGKNFHQIFY